MTNAYAGRIPNWDDSGLLPPFLDNRASPRDRSPYRASLSETVVRFGIESADRRELLSELLNFRAALHEAGLTAVSWKTSSHQGDARPRILTW